MNFRLAIAIAMISGSLAACSDDGTKGLLSTDEKDAVRKAGPNQQIAVNSEILSLRPAANPDRNAYFGDLHVHTAYSFDAYAFGTIATPDDAYRYAKGQALPHPSGYDVQLRQPLDFYAVTDHAMFLGLVKEAADTSTDFSNYSVAENLHNINAPDNMGVMSMMSRVTGFANFIPDTLKGLADGSIDQKIVTQVSKSAWLDTIRAANEAYVPGSFTTFAAFEYTSSTDERGNLHRNVIFKDTDKLPAVPFSRFNSQNPEGLWDWMDDLRAQNIESLAIPHNSNGSNGAMFELTDWAGKAIDNDYATQRLRNEPLVEITQVKGTSETHPVLSTNDEWADFEIVPYRVATRLLSEPKGSYVREAYLDGLEMAKEAVFNPYRFGLVGSSDTHTGAISQDEETFFSKAGVLDGTPEMRGSVPAPFLQGAFLKMQGTDILKTVEGKDYMSSGFQNWSASGLAAVWAEENTREAIYAAFRRKETFATSGPRIKLRFFAGFDFDGTELKNADLVSHAYASATTMGGELHGRSDAAPSFLVWAVADAQGTALQRVQVIKGYMSNGEAKEVVYDVACSDGLRVDSKTNRCPDNGAKVNLADCSITAGVGAGELRTLWQDPDFDASQEAFYYVRVLENPTCRWSTWDAISAGTKPRPDLHATLQERAWSSPIWYRPSI